jgi:NDP-sugar pyrophosphorylase family protein
MSRIEGATALLFAAGWGSRLKPFTDHHPKALAVVNGKTLLDRNIAYLRSFGVSNIVINVHHFADQIMDAVSSRSDASSIAISHEKEQPLETGGGLVFARHFFDNSERPFVVMNVDILTNLNLAELYEHHVSANHLSTLAVTNRFSSRQFLFTSSMQLCGWKNNATAEYRWSADWVNDARGFAFSGVHIISPKIFNLLPSSGIFSISDSYIQLAAHESIFGFDHSGDAVIDVGKPESIAEAEQVFN